MEHKTDITSARSGGWVVPDDSDAASVQDWDQSKTISSSCFTLFYNQKNKAKKLRDNNKRGFVMCITLNKDIDTQCAAEWVFNLNRLSQDNMLLVSAVDWSI